MNDQAIKRVVYLARFLFIWAVLIVARLIQLQVLQHGDYQRQALNQQERMVDVQAVRGKILDRENQPLAMSMLADSVCINPQRVPDLPLAADILAKTLNIDASELLEKMQDAAAQGNGFLWVKRRISEDESKTLHSLQQQLEWIEFRGEYQRVYPNGPLAAHVIGSVDFDQNGNAGIEQTLNEELEGQDGKTRVMTDVRQAGFGEQVANKSEPGRDIRLTIDTRIQRVAEEQLMKTILFHHCKTGSIVVIDPKTGDILAMASYPTFDPNTRAKPGQDLSARTNLAISTPFEPGSVFKVITLSTALETTRLRPESIINCGNGSITIFGRTIHDHKSYPALSMEDVLVHSSNIGAIRIGMTIGAPALYDYIRRFRFGQRTGILLPGESPGLVHKLKAWQPTSIGSVPMGHEIMVTTLQLAQACAIVANNGFYVRPRITFDTPVAVPIAVLKPETAITMRHLMESVVLRGTGTKARLDEYTAGGKTGTAQIVDLKTHTYTHLYNASFMGFSPVNNPRVVAVVTVNGASGEAGYGGQASAPVFKEIVSTALRLGDVPPDIPEDDRPKRKGQPVDTNDLAIADLGSVPNLEPDDAPAASKAQPDDAMAMQIGPKVPNFSGMTMRDVLQQSSAKGIPVEFVGSGLVRTQYPAPGNVLPSGERVRVQFSHY
jgi:cell division protein FtsI (penicillin-binding protein 3)